LRIILFLALCVFTSYCSEAQSKSKAKPQILLRGGILSYSEKGGVKAFLDLSPGIAAANGIGVGAGVGYTAIPQIKATAVPLFVRFSYLPLDAAVSPAFQFHVGAAPFSKELDGMTYNGGLFLHASGGIGFNIKKNRGLLLQAGYSKFKVTQKTTAGNFPVGDHNYDGWNATLGFKF